MQFMQNTNMHVMVFAHRYAELPLENEQETGNTGCPWGRRQSNWEQESKRRPFIINSFIGLQFTMLIYYLLIHWI